MRTKYTWILPIRDETESLPQLMAEIKNAMRGKFYEIIAVNDYSTDETAVILSQLAKKNSFLKIINLSISSGKWAALRTGLEVAKGEIIITSDSDLQDDPAEVKKLLSRFANGYDLVSGWRKRRIDPFYKILISKIGNRLVSFLGLGNFHDINSSFKVYRREVLDDIPKQGSLLRFSNVFARKLGYKVAEVAVDHRPRVFGESKFGFVKYARIIYDLILVVLLFSGSGRVEKRLK